MAEQQIQKNLEQIEGLRPGPDLQQVKQETKEALQKELHLLGSSLDMIVKRLDPNGRSAMEVYGSFKNKLLGSLKKHMPDFDRLSIPQVLDRLGTLDQTVTDDFLGQDFKKVHQDIQATTESVLRESGLTEAQITQTRDQLFGTQDFSAKVNTFRTAAAELAKAGNVPGAVEKNLAEDTVLTGPLNFLRGVIGMSDLDVAPREMMRFFTSFRHAELKERGADFTPDNFRKYVDQNQGTFLNLFQESKVGVSSFMEFLKNSPGSVRDVFGAVSEHASEIRNFTHQLSVVETSLAELGNTSLRKELQDSMQQAMDPLLKQYGLTTTGNLKEDILALRHSLDNLAGTVEALDQMNSMPLVEKAAFIQILDQLKAGKLTGDMVALAFFALEMLVGFNGGLIPTDAGKWAGSTLLESIKPMMPSLNLQLNAEQVQGAIILTTALVSAFGLAAGTSAVVRAGYAAQGIYEPGSPEAVAAAQQQAAPEARPVEDPLLLRAASVHEAAMSVADFNDASKNVLRRAIAGNGKLDSYVSEDPAKIRRYRGALLQMRDELQQSLQAHDEGAVNADQISDMVSKYYDAAAGAVVRRSIQGLELSSLSKDDLTARIRERLRQDGQAPAGFDARAAEIAGYIDQVRQFNASAHARSVLQAYLAKVNGVYNQIEEVKRDASLRISADELNLEKGLPIAETNETAAENQPETPLMTKIELQARAALFSIEKKYDEKFRTQFPDWIAAKFGTKEHMLRVFGNAIMNSLLRAIMRDTTGNYVASTAQFSGTQVERWFLQLPDAQHNSQVILPESFNSQWEKAKLDPQFPKLVTEELNRLISQAAGEKTASQDLLLDESYLGVGPVDRGLSGSEQAEARTENARLDGEKRAIAEESATLVPKLQALKDALGTNAAFQMLSVLRNQVLTMQSSGAALQFIGQKMQQTMLEQGGTSSFVEAWSRIAAQPDMTNLLASYDKLRERAFTAGVTDQALVGLEGEVAAIHTMAQISTPELLEMLDAARAGDFWRQMGQVGKVAWGISKFAFAVVGLDRVTSWLKIPEWVANWQQSSLSSLPNLQLPAAQVDVQGLVNFSVLTLSQYGAGALTALQSHAFPEGAEAGRVDAGRLGVRISELLANQFDMTETGGVWRFNKEQEQLNRIDRFLQENGREAEQMRRALYAKYGIAEAAGDARLQLRQHLIAELQASYAERRQAALTSAASLAYETIKLQANEANMPNKDAWIKEQMDRVNTLYLSVLKNQMDRQ